MNDPSEGPRRLLQRYVEGDEQALSELLERELPWLREYVSQRLGAHLRAKEETMDHVQDALLDFLRGAPRFTVGSTAQLRALLARVVDNNLRDRDDWYRAKRRARNREQPLPSDSVLRLQAVPSVTSPSEATDAQQWRAWVRLAIELLDPDDRKVIVLREWDGLSFVEIGSQLGVAENSARMRWVRAVGRLADRITLLRQGGQP